MKQPKSPSKGRDNTAKESGEPARADAGKGADAEKSAVVGKGELRSSADKRTGFISGIKSFGVKRIQYSNVNGVGIFEGDIAIGPVEQLERASAAADTAGLSRDMTASGHHGPNVAFAVAITGQRYRWPGALIPYQVQPELVDTVTAAIRHWQEQTSIRFVERTPSNAATYPNYVSFEVRDGCWSPVGMQGGEQVISIGPGCGVGQCIHEIGHAVGLWHEQSREDRDQYVRIAWENIIPDMQHNFDQHITDGDDIGPYDYNSIMHYPAKAFSVNDQDTIVALSGEPIGQRAGLSAGDVAAVAQLYPYAFGTRHLYTTSLIDLANAVRDNGYRSEGITFFALPTPMPELYTVPLLRLTHPERSDFYTTSDLEASQRVTSDGYALGDVAGYLFACPIAGLLPLYRLDNKQQDDQLLTTSVAEAQQAATEHSYEGQGVAAYVLTSYAPGTVPFFRLSKSS